MTTWICTCVEPSRTFPLFHSPCNNQGSAIPPPPVETLQQTLFMDGWRSLCLLPVPPGNSFALGLTRVHSCEGNVVPYSELLTKHTLAGLGVFFSTFGREKGGSRSFLWLFLVQRGSSRLFPLRRIHGL